MPPVVLIPPKVRSVETDRETSTVVESPMEALARELGGARADGFTPVATRTVPKLAIGRKPLPKRRAASRGIPSSVDVVTCWADLVHPARRLADERLARFGMPPRSVPARVKQPTLLLGEGSEGLLFVNLRYDFNAADGSAYLFGCRVCSETFRPLDTGFLADIPNPLEHTTTGRLGPEDQRIIKHGDETLLVFNMHRETGQRRMHVHILETGHTVELSLRGRPLLDIEKNWMPFEVNGELRFIYRVEPLTIIRVTDLIRGECEVIHDECPEEASVHGKGELELHGGTELKLWRWPYYVGFVHSCAPWRPMLAILDARNNRWVHIGSMFDVPKPETPEAEEWRGKSVQFPASFNLVHDRMLVGMEFEDRCPALLRMPLDFIEEVIP